jgi:hypothetical protein
LLLNIGSMFLKSLSGIMNDHGVVEIKQHWHKNSILCTRFWEATLVKECRLWEIKWHIQWNAYGPMAISIRRKNKGNLVQTLAVCSSTQKNWGQGTKACLAQGSNHDVTWLVTISVPVLGEVPELLSGGCSPMESAKSTEKEVLDRILLGV